MGYLVLLLLLFSTLSVCNASPSPDRHRLHIFAREEEVDIPTIDNDQACGTINAYSKVTDPFGYITSPNYDPTGLVPYPELINCTWILIAEPDYRFNIKFISFNLENNCFKSGLRFYDGIDEKAILIDSLCGTKYRNFRTPHNLLKIKFNTGRRDKHSVPQSNGFKLYFSVIRDRIKCGDGQRRCRNYEKCVDDASLCDGVYDCSDGSDEQKCPVKSINFSTLCGKRPPVLKYPSWMLNLLIIGGTESRPRSWPWQVDFRLESDEPSGHRCAGVILNRLWVLSAAHCFRSSTAKEEITVHFAKHRSLLRDSTEFTRYIDQIFMHPDFDSTSRNNDLALIRLSASLPDDNPHTSAICLPSVLPELIGYNATLLSIIGWGQNGMYTESKFLMETSVPLVDRNLCAKWLKAWTITDNMVCAGFQEGGYDTCKGDSGGPLMYYNDTTEQYEVTGITSHGLPCCGCREQPGVYTNVFNFKRWIEETIANNSKLELNS